MGTWPVGVGVVSPAWDRHGVGWGSGSQPGAPERALASAWESLGRGLGIRVSLAPLVTLRYGCGEGQNRRPWPSVPSGHSSGCVCCLTCCSSLASTVPAFPLLLAEVPTSLPCPVPETPGGPLQPPPCCGSGSVLGLFFLPPPGAVGSAAARQPLRCGPNTLVRPRRVRRLLSANSAPPGHLRSAPFHDVPRGSHTRCCRGPRSRAWGCQDTCEAPCGCGVWRGEGEVQQKALSSDYRSFSCFICCLILSCICLHFTLCWILYLKCLVEICWHCVHRREGLLSVGPLGELKPRR